jgi:hypothetical protein
MDSHPREPMIHEDGLPGSEAALRPRPVYEPRYPGSGRLAGKVAIVTGADSGIGRAVAALYAREGANVAVVYLNEHEDANETQRIIERENGRALLIPGDVGDKDFCQRAIDQVIECFGRLDILVRRGPGPDRGSPSPAGSSGPPGSSRGCPASSCRARKCAGCAPTRRRGGRGPTRGASPPRTPAARPRRTAASPARPASAQDAGTRSPPPPRPSRATVPGTGASSARPRTRDPRPRTPRAWPPCGRAAAGGSRAGRARR